MKADDARAFSFIEVATDSSADLLAQTIEIIRFGKNGLAQRPRDVASFDSLFDEKDKLAHFILSQSA
jgi:hypothetical protein